MINNCSYILRYRNVWCISIIMHRPKFERPYPVYHSPCSTTWLVRLRFAHIWRAQTFSNLSDTKRSSALCSNAKSIPCAATSACLQQRCTATVEMKKKTTSIKFDRKKRYWQKVQSNWAYFGHGCINRTNVASVENNDFWRALNDIFQYFVFKMVRRRKCQTLIWH